MTPDPRRDIVRQTLRAFEAGRLTSHGRLVTSRRQALAMGLSKARRAGQISGYEAGRDAMNVRGTLRNDGRDVIGWWWSSWGSKPRRLFRVRNPRTGKSAWYQLSLTRDEAVNYRIRLQERYWGSEVTMFTKSGGRWRYGL